MKVFLDEHLDGLEEYLLSLGWEVTSVKKEKMSGAKDYQIVLHAKKKKYVLVTMDEKPARIAGLHDVKVIWISSDKMAALVDKELRNLLKQ